METIPEMTVAEVERVGVTGDAGRVADERPDPEVPERARRRRFTAQYKLDVVAEYDAAPTGEKGAVLRREGLYSSHVIEWRRARDAGGLAGPSGGRSAGRADRAAAQGEGQAGAGAGQGPLRGGRPGKTSGALGTSCPPRLPALSGSLPPTRWRTAGRPGCRPAGDCAPPGSAAIRRCSATPAPAPRSPTAKRSAGSRR